MAVNPFLEVVNLRCRFGGVDALRDVSFSLSKESITTVIGPNGAGKSTLLGCISGEFKPKKGKVFLENKEITGAKAWKVPALGIARTFQIPRVVSHLNTFDNVFLPIYARSRGVGSKKMAAEKAAHMLELCGLIDQSDLEAKELSTAQIRRLELARAMGLNPRLLLLDEPLGGLSPTQVDETLELILKLRSLGITVVAVEHVVRAALEIADSAIFLSNGQLIGEGEPREVLAREDIVEMYLGGRFLRRGQF
jgi:branched-chain amino acid transport system ATP-binding protein